MDPISGLKIDVQQVIGAASIEHSLTLAPGAAPGYSMTGSIANSSQTRAVITRVDSTKSLFAKAVSANANSNLAIQTQMDAPNDPSGRGRCFLLLDGDYSARTWTSGFKLQFPSTIIGSFTQAISRQLAIGLLAATNFTEIATLTAVARYQPNNKSLYVMTASGTNFGFGSMFSPYAAVAFGADLNVGRTQEGGWSSTLVGGVEAQYTLSKWKATLDNQLKLSTTYEEVLSNVSRLSITMETSYPKMEPAFGVGISFQQDIRSQGTPYAVV